MDSTGFGYRPPRFHLLDQELHLDPEIQRMGPGARNADGCPTDRPALASARLQPARVANRRHVPAASTPRRASVHPRRRTFHATSRRSLRRHRRDLQASPHLRPGRTGARRGSAPAPPPARRMESRLTARAHGHGQHDRHRGRIEHRDHPGEPAHTPKRVRSHQRPGYPNPSCRRTFLPDPRSRGLPHRPPRPRLLRIHPTPAPRVPQPPRLQRHDQVGRPGAIASPLA